MILLRLDAAPESNGRFRLRAQLIDAMHALELHGQADVRFRRRIQPITSNLVI